MSGVLIVAIFLPTDRREGKVISLFLLGEEEGRKPGLLALNYSEVVAVGCSKGLEDIKGKKREDHQYIHGCATSSMNLNSTEGHRKHQLVAYS